MFKNWMDEHPVRAWLAASGLIVATAGGVTLATNGETASAAHAPKPHCTQTDGMCDVIQFTFPGNGNQVPRLFTCFLTRLPSIEGQGDLFGGYTCNPDNSHIPFP